MRHQCPQKMRGPSTGVDDCRKKCEDNPRAWTIVAKNAKTIHGRRRLSQKMRGQSTGVDDCRKKCGDHPRAWTIAAKNAETIHGRRRWQQKMLGFLQMLFPPVSEKIKRRLENGHREISFDHSPIRVISELYLVISLQP